MNLPDENWTVKEESFANSAPLGTLSESLLERPRGHSLAQQSLADAGLGTDGSPEPSKARKRLKTILYWSGEVIGALSLFGTLYILQFFGGIYQ